MNAVWHALADPWSGDIMRRAAIELVVLGVTGAAIGCWVVLGGLSYAAESLPHAMFPGLVLAALSGASLLAGGAGGLLVAAVAIALVRRSARTEADTAVAVVVTTLFGLGVLLALAPATPAGIQSLLFGDILGLTTGDVVGAAVLAVVLLAMLRLLHTRLVIASFDRTTARSLGADPTLLDLALLGLLAAAVLIAVQALGNLLVVALVVAPAAVARLVTRRLLPMMGVAALVAIACGIGGLYASYYLSIAAGASVALVMVLVYLTAMAARRIA